MPLASSSSLLLGFPNKRKVKEEEERGEETEEEGSRLKEEDAKRGGEKEEGGDHGLQHNSFWCFHEYGFYCLSGFYVLPSMARSIPWGIPPHQQALELVHTKAFCKLLYLLYKRYIYIYAIYEALEQLCKLGEVICRLYELCIGCIGASEDHLLRVPGLGEHDLDRGHQGHEHYARCLGAARVSSCLPSLIIVP